MCIRDRVSTQSTWGAHCTPTIDVINEVVQNQKYYKTVKTYVELLKFYTVYLSQNLKSADESHTVKNVSQIAFFDVASRYCTFSDEEKKIFENDTTGHVDFSEVEYCSSDQSTLRSTLFDFCLLYTSPSPRDS
eukprot:TRINITY_DN8995_c0_g1_i1.p1 TRINITY_DN8995_c0_g1~~TRINITY_DN8995_c0_g1_i1.p1  ORF type:complete len:133 (+),score=43.18 TRINITY_DN8995_c0_g1_i1:61-459(+)